MELKFDQVFKRIKGATVIDHVSMCMTSGRVYGLWGYNGSGKTMLMRMMAGLIYPTSGTVSIDGKVLGKELDFPDRIGLLLENPAFLYEFSGFQNLQLLVEIKQIVSAQMVRDTLCRVGLNPEDSKPYRKYPLGMKQRLGIAAAVVEQPDLVLLDEPTNALDEDGMSMLKRLIQQERERGALIVVASHERDFLESVSDVLCRIEGGRLTEWKEQS